MKIADVARETGLNRNTITLLYKETATRVDLDAIEKLCELFECEVGQHWSVLRSDCPPWFSANSVNHDKLA